MNKKNRCYINAIKINPTGVMIHSVGCNQPDRKVFERNWNNPNVTKCTHAIVDNKGVSQLLPYNYKSWHAGTGTTGRSANNTHISIEMTEPRCLIYAGGARIKSYDEVEGFKHFRATLDNLIPWTVDRLNEFNLPVNSIICHADGYKLGIASNHADIYHWWNLHSYNMDDFRQEVFNKMNSDNTKRYDKIEDMPEWSQKYISSLVRLGYISGYEDGRLDLSLDMIRCLIVSGRMSGVF